MKIKTLLAGAIVALAATVAKMPVADANPERLAKMAEELKLTPETLQQLNEIFPGPGGSAPEAYAW